MMRGEGMRIGAAVAARVRVHVEGGQPRLGVEEGMADFLDNAVTLACRQILIDRGVQLGLEPVPQPAHPYVVDIFDTGHCGRHPLNAVHYLRLDSIHQALPHRDGRVRDDEEDRHGDEQSDDGVGQGKPDQQYKGSGKIEFAELNITEKLPIGNSQQQC